MLSLLSATYRRRSIVWLIAAVLDPCVIAWLSAMIPVTPPLGSVTSSFLLTGSHALTTTLSCEPPILIVVATPGVNVPTIVSTVNTMLYLNTLPAAPDAAERAAS